MFLPIISFEINNGERKQRKGDQEECKLPDKKIFNLCVMVRFKRGIGFTGSVWMGMMYNFSRR